MREAFVSGCLCVANVYFLQNEAFNCYTCAVFVYILMLMGIFLEMVILRCVGMALFLKFLKIVTRIPLSHVCHYLSMTVFGEKYCLL